MHRSLLSRARGAGGKVAGVLALLVASGSSLVLFAGPASASVNELAVVSGNGSYNSPDSEVQFSADNGASWTAATVTDPNQPGRCSYGVIPGTEWDSGGQNCPGGGNPESYWFETTFSLPSGYADASISIDAQADDYVSAILLNGTTIFTGGEGDSPVNVSVSSSSAFETGSNTLLFETVNLGGAYGVDFSASVGYLTAPYAPTVITSPGDGSSVTSSSLTVQGTADDNASVAIFDNGSPVATTTASGSGGWSAGVTLSVGTNSLTAQQADGLTGALSDAVVVTLLIPQAISFAPIPDRYVNSPSFTVSATGGASGNAVSFSTQSTGVCSVAAAGTVTLTGASGSCKIEADQAGNGQYAAAAPVDQSFDVLAVQPQGVTLSAPPPAYYGGSFTVTATGGGSGNPITFSSGGGSGCTVTPGGLVTLTAAGENNCTIAADQAGGVGWAAGAASETFSVNPAPVTISAEGVTTTYGAGPPTFGYTVSGLLGSDQLSIAPTCGVNGSDTDAATYTIDCSGASAGPDYAIAYKSATLTVNAAQLVITSSSGPMTYGGAPPAITASYSGFENGDGPSSLTTPPTCSTVASSSSPVGNYDSSCAGAEDANYSIGYADGTVSVDPAPLEITAFSAPMTYGGSVPTITPSYSGFVNGDGAGSLTTQPTCSTKALSSSPVGSYATSCTGAADPNYTITEIPGSVTIGQAPLVVQAVDQSMLFGQDVPALTVSFSGFVNGDSPSAVSGSAACQTTATSTSPGGSYPITCAAGTLSAKNYALSFAPGTLTIGYSQACITGTYRGPFVVGPHQSICLGAGAVLTGPVSVAATGSLDIEGASVSGPIRTFLAGALRVCAADLHGPIVVAGDSEPTLIGDGSGCAPSTIDGPVSLAVNDALVSVVGASITGPLSFTGNADGVVADANAVGGPLSVTLNYGGVTVENNTVDGPLTVLLDAGTVTVSGNQAKGPARAR